MEEDKKKIYHLYVLLWEDNKYYIGITAKSDPYKRIYEHMNGFYTAQWVKKYKVIRVIEMLRLGEITHEAAEEYENKRTLQYMGKCGYQNVRGGKFNYSGKYVKIGDRFWRDAEFKTLSVILLLLMSVALLLIKDLR